MIHDVIMPKLGETMEEGYIAAWKKKEGEKVAKGDVLLEVMSDKTNFEVEALSDGILRKILFEQSEEAIPVTTVIGYIGDTADEPLPATKTAPVKPAVKQSAAPVAEAPAVQPDAVEEGDRIRISPLARRLAKEQGIDISRVKGTGPGGRIEKNDIVSCSPARKTDAAATPPASPGGWHIKELSPMRKTIAERLSRSKATIPHFYLEGSISTDAVASLKERKKKEGLEATITDFIVYFTARIMTEFPLVNAAFADNQIRLYDTVDIGIAVGVEDGLFVPVVHDCAGKTLAQISADIKALAAKARAGALKRDETDGARFVVSNLGMFGVDNFLAIINPPGVAIMAVGGIEKIPAVSDGVITVKSVMHISFSFDHRVIDGAYGARFFRRLKDVMEQPGLLLV